MEKNNYLSIPKSIEQIFYIDDLKITYIISEAGTQRRTRVYRSNIFHMHQFYEFLYLCSGAITIELENETIELSSGSAICIAPKVNHRMSYKEEPVDYVCNFYIEKNPIKVKNNFFDSTNAMFSKPYLYLENCTVLQSTMANLFSNHFFPYEDNPIKISFYFFELLIKLMDITHAESKATVLNDSDGNIGRVHKINNIIFSHYHQDLTLSNIADEINLSARQTDRIIQQTYGCPLHAMITSLRMKDASDLLLSTDISVSEISRMIGYSSVNGFYIAFKKHYSVLPSEYRKQKSIKA